MTVSHKSVSASIYLFRDVWYIHLTNPCHVHFYTYSGIIPEVFSTQRCNNKIAVGYRTSSSYTWMPKVISKPWGHHTGFRIFKKKKKNTQQPPQTPLLRSCFFGTGPGNNTQRHGSPEGKGRKTLPAYKASLSGYLGSSTQANSFSCICCSHKKIYSFYKWSDLMLNVLQRVYVWAKECLQLDDKVSHLR